MKWNNDVWFVLNFTTIILISTASCGIIGAKLNVLSALLTHQNEQQKLQMRCATSRTPIASKSKHKTQYLVKNKSVDAILNVLLSLSVTVWPLSSFQLNTLSIATDFFPLNEMYLDCFDGFFLCFDKSQHKNIYLRLLLPWIRSIIFSFISTKNTFNASEMYKLSTFETMAVV